MPSRLSFIWAIVHHRPGSRRQCRRLPGPTYSAGRRSGRDRNRIRPANRRGGVIQFGVELLGGGHGWIVVEMQCPGAMPLADMRAGPSALMVLPGVSNAKSVTSYAYRAAVFVCVGLVLRSRCLHHGTTQDQHVWPHRRSRIKGWNSSPGSHRHTAFNACRHPVFTHGRHAARNPAKPPRAKARPIIS